MVAARDADGKPERAAGRRRRRARRARRRRGDGRLRLGRAQRAAAGRRRTAISCATPPWRPSSKGRADVSRARDGDGLVDGEVAAGEGAEAAAGPPVSAGRRRAGRGAGGRRRPRSRPTIWSSAPTRSTPGPATTCWSPSATRRASRSARSWRPAPSPTFRSTPPSSPSSIAWRSTVKRDVDDAPAAPRRRGDARGGRRGHRRAKGSPSCRRARPWRGPRFAPRAPRRRAGADRGRWSPPPARTGAGSWPTSRRRSPRPAGTSSTSRRRWSPTTSR